MKRTKNRRQRETSPTLVSRRRATVQVYGWMLIRTVVIESGGEGRSLGGPAQTANQQTSPASDAPAAGSSSTESAGSSPASLGSELADTAQQSTTDSQGLTRPSQSAFSDDSPVLQKVVDIIAKRLQHTYEAKANKSFREYGCSCETLSNQILAGQGQRLDLDDDVAAGASTSQVTSHCNLHVTLLVIRGQAATTSNTANESTKDFAAEQGDFPTESE